MQKLVIIDGNAIMHRAFHAMPPLTTPKGEPINAVHGFVSMLLKVIQDVKPTSIAVAFDRKEKTFRGNLLPTYQAQRPPMANELSSQFAKVQDFLTASNIPVYSKAGYEADDIIGTIASEAIKSKRVKEYKSESNKTYALPLSRSPALIDEVIIVTGDRDQLQLVNDKLKIKLYMPVVGLTNAKMYGEKETIERMGVPPVQIDDLKALTGDASDNYKGIPGIGPKTAIGLLSKYKSVENIYKNLDEIPEKTREKLEKGKTDGELSKKLATIVCDVPIEIDFEAMEKWKIDSPEVLELFINNFGFKTLTKRVQDVGKAIDEQKQGVLF